MVQQWEEVRTRLGRKKFIILPGPREGIVVCHRGKISPWRVTSSILKMSPASIRRPKNQEQQQV